MYIYVHICIYIYILKFPTTICLTLSHFIKVDSTIYLYIIT